MKLNEEFRDEFRPVRKEALDATTSGVLDSAKAKLEEMKEKYKDLPEMQAERLERTIEIVNKRLDRLQGKSK